MPVIKPQTIIKQEWKITTQKRAGMWRREAVECTSAEESPSWPSPHMVLCGYWVANEGLRLHWCAHLLAQADVQLAGAAWDAGLHMGSVQGGNFWTTLDICEGP